MQWGLQSYNLSVRLYTTTILQFPAIHDKNILYFSVLCCILLSVYTYYYPFSRQSLLRIRTYPRRFLSPLFQHSAHTTSPSITPFSSPFKSLLLLTSLFSSSHYTLNLELSQTKNCLRKLRTSF